MIITRLLGGLGNQLFQYAAGRALAERHHTLVKVDTRWFSSQTIDREAHSRYYLDAFRCDPPIATSREIRRLEERPETLTARWRSWLLRTDGVPDWLRRSAPPARLFRETQVGPYQPAFAALPDQVYLAGMWQSARYFDAIGPLLRHELSPRRPPAGRNQAVLGTIAAQTDSVAVHVRRGDYVRNPVYRAGLGLCDCDYYRAAFERIRTLVDAPRFFVFSDEPAAAREVIPAAAEVTFVDHNSGPLEAVDDLRLMRACRHHVIANSTFSWWAAWLADQPGQQVIGPRRWFQGFDYDASDIQPPAWQLV